VAVLFFAYENARALKAGSSMLVEVENLSKTFGDFRAVDDVSFGIERGEIIGLLGANGAGKTTTIHMILGLITPTSGRISIFGKSMATHRGEILEHVNFTSPYSTFPFRLTAYLDPEIAWQVKNALLDAQREKGTTILYTSHNMDEVERMCKRIIFLHHGKIIAAGSPIEITQAILEEEREEPALEEVFMRVVRGKAA
jgi:ABC-type multidrug transport system ATPase subunit